LPPLSITKLLPIAYHINVHIDDCRLNHWPKACAFVDSENWRRASSDKPDSQKGVTGINDYAVRRAITKSTWAEIRTAYASGIGLREIARNIGIPAGTVLARAKREGWSRQVNNAKALAKREEAAKAITPFEAASATMHQRGERHLGRMANIVEKTIPHVEAMEPGAILDRVDDVEKLDKVARRTFGISDDDVHGNNVVVNIGILG
jgi:hypothetical protein